MCRERTSFVQSLTKILKKFARGLKYSKILTRFPIINALSNY